jgi:hypothetical protein
MGTISWRPGPVPGLRFWQVTDGFMPWWSSLTSASGCVRIRVSRACSIVSRAHELPVFPRHGRELSEIGQLQLLWSIAVRSWLLQRILVSA